MTNFEKLRKRMVAEQIYARGVRDEQVLAAMARVPRELFVPEEFRDHAFERFSRADQGRTGGGAGLGLAMDWLSRFRVESEDIDYLRSLRGNERHLTRASSRPPATRSLTSIASIGSRRSPPTRRQPCLSSSCSA